MEGFQIKTNERISDIFDINSDNLASDDEYPVYLASMQKYPDLHLPQNVLLKRLESTSIYQNLLANNSPCIEKVFGIFETADGIFAVCEYVKRPNRFNYQMYDALYNSEGSGILSLDDLIDPDHFPCFNIPRTDNFHFLGEKTSLTLLLEIIDGLDSFSKSKMVHGDLSPQNILLTDAIEKDSSLPFRPVIIDFGISKPFKKAEHQVTTIVGTKEFAAPEIMTYNKPTDRIDIYSLGCLLHFMILGKAPGENPNGLKDSKNLLSKSVFKIIKKCNADYEIRYRSLRELYRAVKNELNRENSPLYRVISVIPGFRTHKVWKMLIAGYTYLSLITSAFVLIYYRKEIDPINWLGIAYMVVEIICVCDAFNIKRFFPKYIYWRQRRPIIGHLVRILIAVIVTLLFLVLFAVFR